MIDKTKLHDNKEFASVLRLENELEGKIASKTDNIVSGNSVFYEPGIEVLPKDIEKPFILVLKTTDLDQCQLSADMFFNANGIIAGEGSALSHPAVIAREMNIPCILGVDIKKIDSGKTIQLDTTGKQGKVRY